MKKANKEASGEKAIQQVSKPPSKRRTERSLKPRRSQLLLRGHVPLPIKRWRFCRGWSRSLTPSWLRP